MKAHQIPLGSFITEANTLATDENERMLPVSSADIEKIRYLSILFILQDELQNVPIGNIPLDQLKETQRRIANDIDKLTLTYSRADKQQILQKLQRFQATLSGAVALLESSKPDADSKSEADILPEMQELMQHKVIAALATFNSELQSTTPDTALKHFQAKLDEINGADLNKVLDEVEANESKPKQAYVTHTEEDERIISEGRPGSDPDDRTIWTVPNVAQVIDHPKEKGTFVLTIDASTFLKDMGVIPKARNLEDEKLVAQEENLIREEVIKFFDKKEKDMDGFYFHAGLAQVCLKLDEAKVKGAAAKLEGYAKELNEKWLTKRADLVKENPLVEKHYPKVYKAVLKREEEKAKSRERYRRRPKRGDAKTTKAPEKSDVTMETSPPVPPVPSAPVASVNESVQSTPPQQRVEVKSTVPVASGPERFVQEDSEQFKQYIDKLEKRLMDFTKPIESTFGKAKPGKLHVMEGRVGSDGKMGLIREAACVFAAEYRWLIDNLKTDSIDKLIAAQTKVIHRVNANNPVGHLIYQLQNPEKSIKLETKSGTKLDSKFVCNRCLVEYQDGSIYKVAGLDEAKEDIFKYGVRHCDYLPLLGEARVFEPLKTELTAAKRKEIGCHLSGRIIPKVASVVAPSQPVVQNVSQQQNLPPSYWDPTTTAFAEPDRSPSPDDSAPPAFTPRGAESSFWAQPKVTVNVSTDDKDNAPPVYSPPSKTNDASFWDPKAPQVDKQGLGQAGAESGDNTPRKGKK